MGHAIAQELKQICGLKYFTWPKRDDRKHFLFAKLTRHSDNGRFEHRGMRQNLAFYFSGRNILATPPDRILFSVHKIKIADAIL